MPVPCQSSVDAARAALAAAGLVPSPDADLVALLNVVLAASWVGDFAPSDLPPAPVATASGRGALVPECVTDGPGGEPVLWPSVLVWREGDAFLVLKAGEPAASAFADLVEALAWAVEV